MSKFYYKNDQLMILLMILGPVQFIIAILIAERIPVSYNTSIHYVSTLGTSEVSWLFNYSVIFLGICFIICSYLFYKEYNNKTSTMLLLVTGICAIGVGAFPEDQIPLHGIFTGLVFTFSALFLISILRFKNSSLLKFVGIGGFLTFLISLIFMSYLGLDVEDPSRFLGLYKGTLERIVIYINFLFYIILGLILYNFELSSVKKEATVS